MLKTMEDYFSVFRQNMKYYREARKLNQSELAIQADSSNGNIGNIEAGTSKPSFEMIIRIASALKVHPADLFLRDASQSRQKIKKEIESILIGDIKKILKEKF